MNILIIAEGGHGMDTAGKRTPQMPDGRVILEREFNAPVCKKFLSMCKEIGFETLDVAPEDKDVPLSTRTNRANAVYNEYKRNYPDGKCIYLSFHFNAFNGIFDNKAGGVDVHHFPGSAEGKKLAAAVYNELIKGTPQNKRGIKENNFHVLRATIMPAILIEAGFMDKLEEAQLMLNEDFQNEVARETLQGVLNYFGVEAIDWKASYEIEAQKRRFLENKLIETNQLLTVANEKLYDIQKILDK